MQAGSDPPRVDALTIAGWALILMPLLTMWHEIGGHAAMCAGTGGAVRTIGAFYVQCDSPSRTATLLVAFAGVGVNTLAAIVARLLWTRARGDHARLVLWLVWVSEAFVAAGYFCFSGATGAGDLGVGAQGEIGPVAFPMLWRALTFAFGVAAYTLVIRRAFRDLGTMIGEGREAAPARRTIALVYYAISGAAAVLVGLLNPVGLFITIMSAAAATWGGLGGFVAIGRMAPRGEGTRPFAIARNIAVPVAGVVVVAAFALVLGASIHPA